MFLISFFIILQTSILSLQFLDHGYLQIFYRYQAFPLALPIVKRVVIQNGILFNPVTGFTAAKRI